MSGSTGWSSTHQKHISVNKKVLKESTKELKDFEKLCRQPFACEADARKALVAFEKKLKMTSVEDAQIIAEGRYNAAGRPPKGRQPDYYVYRIEGGLASSLEERQRLLQRKSCFIIATNQLDCNELSDEEIISTYKDQQKVEGGFRFLKDPMFMASTIYLESPKRIMALMMVMTLCLLVCSALEYRIRGVLQENGETFPDQKGKPTSRPTARWVFQFFSGIHVLFIGKVRQLILNMNNDQYELLKLPGPRYEQLYSPT